MQYCKPPQETCQQKCLESWYGHKPNNGGSYIAGQSTGLYGQGTYACTDHMNWAKPAMNHSSYGQTYDQPTLANPQMSYSYRCSKIDGKVESKYGGHGGPVYYQDYGHHMNGTKPVSLGQNQYWVDKVHGHGRAGQHGLHGMASCHGKSHEKKKGDPCKKKNKNLISKNRTRTVTRAAATAAAPTAVTMTATEEYTGRRSIKEQLPRKNPIKVPTAKK